MAGAGAVVGAGANGGGAGGGDASDDENDPELQELYVQAYACQIFADDAAAQAVEDDGHLRPLFLPQARNDLNAVAVQDSTVRFVISLKRGRNEHIEPEVASGHVS